MALRNGWQRNAKPLETFLKSRMGSDSKGPPPFTAAELAIVEARKQFQWRVVGIAPNNDLQFEIHNGSRMTLPFLTVGIRGKHRSPNTGELLGAAFLSIGAIRPGETKLVEHGCYKEYVSPQDTVVFDAPDPGPEDRDQYWEFRMINHQ
jgi:hypothetical protein